MVVGTGTGTGVGVVVVLMDIWDDGEGGLLLLRGFCAGRGRDGATGEMLL